MIKTYNQVKEVFPSEGVTTTVVVKADNVRSGDVADRRSPRSRPGQGVDSFLPGTSVTYSDDGTVAEIDIPTQGSGHRCRLDRPPSTRSATRSSRRRSAGSTATTRQRQRRCGASRGLQGTVEQPAALDLRLRLRAGVPAAPGHLPLDRDPDQGDPAQPALRRRRLRSPGARLPGRPRRVAARLHVERRRRLVAAAVPVRDPVRALDGLPRVHPLPGPRGLRLGDEHRRGRPPRDLVDGRDGDQRRLRDGRGVRRLRDARTSST